MISTEEVHKLKNSLNSIFYNLSEKCLPTEQIILCYSGGKIIFEFE